MISRKTETFTVTDKKELVAARKGMMAIAEELGMGPMKETQLRTAATELLSNMLRFGGGGKLTVENVEYKNLNGVRATFEDQGPGIADIDAAMKQGFSTGNSLGHGLSGCKNLVDTFDLTSSLGKGTRVVITKWC